LVDAIPAVVVGVPDIVPVELFIVSPAGNVGQVNTAAPPVLFVVLGVTRLLAQYVTPLA
jgi:hypothetical protein